MNTITVYEKGQVVVQGESLGYVVDSWQVEGMSMLLSKMEKIEREYKIVWSNNGRFFSTIPDLSMREMVEDAERQGLDSLGPDSLAEMMRLAAEGEKQAAEERREASEKASRIQVEWDKECQEKTPSWAKAVLIGELVEDKSDLHSDYHGSSTKRRVILGFSKHKRDLFPEMRKAALNCPETAHLADTGEEAEHREKYSMGGGYYLKDGNRYSNGWQVSKEHFWNESKRISQGEWFLPVKGRTSSARVGGIEQHTHTKKGIEMFIVLIPGELEKSVFNAKREACKAAGGWYSRKWGKTPGGFAFEDMEAAEAFQAEHFGRVDVQKAAGMVNREKFKLLADKMQGEIDSKLADRQTNTPKRMYQATKARNEGCHLQRTQEALRALAELEEVPEVLAGFTSKKAVYEGMQEATDSSRGGYYDNPVGLGKPYKETPENLALWGLVKGQSEEGKAKEKLRQEVEALQFKKIPGYFPTPRGVVERMIEWADFQTGKERVLEPSAGSGAIAEVVAEMYPGCPVECFEVNYTLQQILKTKGLEVTAPDFTQWNSMEIWDRILMNPPFENLQDVDHVLKAYECLKPGGVLVAVMGTGWTFRQDKKSTEFREWFFSNSNLREWHPLEQGTFKESGTGVASVLVKIIKPE